MGRRQRIPSNQIHISKNKNQERRERTLPDPHPAFLSPLLSRAEEANLFRRVPQELISWSAAVKRGLGAIRGAVNTLFSIILHVAVPKALTQSDTSHPGPYPMRYPGAFPQPWYSRNHSANRGMPTSSVVAGAKPVNAVIASMLAQVSSTSTAGRGTS